MPARRAASSLTRSERVVRDASRARRELERNSLRGSIVSAAADVLLEQGVDALSMRQVASRIGYSATTIYHHFVNKDELIKAVLDQALEGFEGAIRLAVEAEPDPSRRMGALGKAYVRFGVSHPVHYQLMVRRHPAWLSTSPSGDGQFRSESYRILLEGVRLGVEKGWLPRTDVGALADWMWATVHGLVMLGITAFRDDPDRLEAALRLFDLPPQGGSDATNNDSSSPQGNP